MQNQPPDNNSASSAIRWKGARSLQLAHALNVRCIDLLCHSATKPFVERLPPMLRENRNLWCQLNVEGRRRLAELPFVIVDARFRDESWWRTRGSIGGDLVAERAAADESLREARASLFLETLMFAWQVAREDSAVAQILFAMSKPVAGIVSSLPMQDIRTLAAERSEALRVRWDEDSQLWRDLLVAVATDDEAALEEVRLHAKLLFCGDLIARADNP